ncbi:helix-turn-helix domain-containing protein [Fulvivirga sp. 29W222]|uniref:Helix-turn-helix domain-containing protein n=1 Tax=Fulvivirga marina TaxID=2494733 RepID=A0A937G345_9BACT|nr:helix-turn-helix transcriptional regulator [Fulvivirga marina]MBL6449812.1 helix-turn-helix domain-containing protein [Fulvivirga marina]
MANENFSLKHIFGLKIRDLRVEKGLSFQELAQKTGLSISYLSEIEKGKKYPKGDKIMQLAEALDESYDNLVSLKVSKRLQPVINLLQSDFFKEFPLHLFGLDAQKIIELISVSPEKINAFISSISLISRNYEMNQEYFYYAALRSYQEMHDNYFPDIEKAVKDFRGANKSINTIPVKKMQLEQVLLGSYGITTDRDELSEFRALKHLRSYYKSKRKKLLLNNELTDAQECFLLGREIGFQYLKLKERPMETPPQRSYNFEELLNNYKASYFSAALLMDEDAVVADVREFAQNKKWDGNQLLSFITKYNATPEMLMQRLTNILPKYFGIKNLFFLRFLGTDDFSSYELTKELHLSRAHNPHANSLNEHYCRRWISIGLIKELRSMHRLKKQIPVLAGAQISRYHETPNEYFCLTIAFPNVSNPNESMSVTIGVYIDNNLRKRIKFIDDPDIVTKVVNTTCERCSLMDCGDRIAPPYHIGNQENQNDIIDALDALEK